MPGSANHKIACQVADWLKDIQDCKINISSKLIAGILKDIELDKDNEIVSFDAKSLYTNVPVKEAIDDCTNLLFSDNYPTPPVDRETFKSMLEICSCDVLMLTHNGYYRQIDDLAMGSPPAPMIANGWLIKFDQCIKGDAVLYGCYIYHRAVKTKLIEINSYHLLLKFTVEREIDQLLPFLDIP